jgi:hypothetical protein
MEAKSMAWRLAFAACVLASGGSTMAKDSCGSGWNRWIVPESFAGCRFASACTHHDVCYGVCDPGGARENTDYCRLPESSPERVAAKKVCDDGFFTEIVSDNPGKRRCEILAALYRAAVVKYGRGPFNGLVASDRFYAIADASATPEEALKKYELLDRLATEHVIQPSGMRVQGDALLVPLQPGNERFGGAWQRGRMLVLPRGMSTQSLDSLEQRP